MAWSLLRLAGFMRQHERSASSEAHGTPLATNDEPSRCFVRCVIEANAAHELAKLRTKAALTQAEVEVLGCALLRMTYREIAAARGVSLNTVKSQMKALLAKLCIERTTDLAEALANLPGEPFHYEFMLRLEVRPREAAGTRLA